MKIALLEVYLARVSLTRSSSSLRLSLAALVGEKNSALGLDIRGSLAKKSDIISIAFLVPAGLIAGAVLSTLGNILANLQNCAIHSLQLPVFEPL